MVVYWHGGVFLVFFFTETVYRLKHSILIFRHELRLSLQARSQLNALVYIESVVLVSDDFVRESKFMLDHAL